MRKIPIGYCRHRALSPLILAECNIVICPNVTALKLKVILFSSRVQMREFFRVAWGIKMHRSASAFCIARQAGLTPDSRFFCVICLVRTVLKIECVAHEAVHAAHRFDERTGYTGWHGFHPEEKLCYPAGYITGAICEWLRSNQITI